MKTNANDPQGETREQTLARLERAMDEEHDAAVAAGDYGDTETREHTMGPRPGETREAMFERLEREIEADYEAAEAAGEPRCVDFWTREPIPERRYGTAA